MRLKPFKEIEVIDEEMNAAIQSTLEESGIVEPEIADNEEIELSHVQKIFKSRGAGIAAAASKVSTLMDSDREEISLKATEIALKANGIYADLDKKVKSVPAINITIMNGGNSNNSNLINLVMPSV